MPWKAVHHSKSLSRKEAATSFVESVEFLVYKRSWQCMYGGGISSGSGGGGGGGGGVFPYAFSIISAEV